MILFSSTIKKQKKSFSLKTILFLCSS